MSWNGNDNNKDPWGRKDGPPDIDEAIDQFKKKLGGIFGGSGGSGPVSYTHLTLPTTPYV